MSDETKNATKDDEFPAWQQEQMRAAWEKWNSGAMDGGPATTPTAALVEEAETMAARTQDPPLPPEVERLLETLATALRRAEAGRERAELARWKAEHEGDLAIAERDEARAQVWGLICAGSNMAERKRYFQGLWETLLDAGLKTDRKISELTATRDLLTDENARLQKERDALTRAWVEAAGLTMHAELLKTIEELRALGFGLGCMLTNARGWLQLMSHHSEQHMELRAHIATLELLLRGGK